MNFRTSLVDRLAVVVGAIVLAALVGMIATLSVSKSIEGNATAINQSGALRMGAFQLLSEAASGPNRESGARALDNLVSSYTERLASNGITQAIPDAQGHPLAAQHQTIVNLWNASVRPYLENRDPGTSLSADLVLAVNNYVREVDRFVAMLEERTEARIDLLHLIQLVSLGFTIVIVFALFFDLKNRVLHPLRKLVAIAGAIQHRDFSRRANLKGGDELAQLGDAFDRMAHELANSYHDLEEHVLTKTQELEKSHAALQLLHVSSRSLFTNHDLCDGAVPMLQELEQLLGVGPIQIFLHDKTSPEPVRAVTTATRERPFYCRDHHCNACLVKPEQYDELPTEDNDGRRLLLPIRTPGKLLGTLEVWYPADSGLSETSRRLLETLSDQLATAILLEQQNNEEQQLTLAEERTVIARELHDSLAQSLSYLKMQVARLRRLNIDGEHKAHHSEILDELSTGLNSAYRQLRELLTTFRLKLDTPDLYTALGYTVREFSERLGKPVPLNYNLPPNTLSANEEIHTLQIIREGLANAVKHAGASEVTVEVLFESPKVQARVCDNGKGLPGNGQPVSHYGLIIMQDRARTLGGQVKVSNREEGGVEVSLSFVPKSRNLIPAEIASA